MSVSSYNQAGIGVDLSSCLGNQFTAIAPNRLTIVNGQSDSFFAGQDPLQKVSGFSCPAGSFQCWSPDGSGAGWYIVQDVQASDGKADHCYMLKDGCGFSSVEPYWAYPYTYNWSLRPNLDWLATFGKRRVFSPTGQ
jgi:hypothetical protein